MILAVSVSGNIDDRCEWGSGCGVGKDRDAMEGKRKKARRGDESLETKGKM